MKTKKLISLVLLSALAINLAPQPTPTVDAATDDIKAVASGARHTAIIKSDNTLWLYGDNSSGQLGVMVDEDGNPIRALESTQSMQIMSGIKDVAVGKNTTVALKTDGSVWVWGYNVYEQLGGVKAKPKSTGGTIKDDDSNIITEPVQLMTGVKDVAAGDGFMMALKTDGSLYSWGSNIYSQLGFDKSEVDSRGRLLCYKPTKILSGVASISAGSHHAAAVKTDGSLYLWGDNSHTQCGFVTSGGHVQKPKEIMSSGVKAVSCGDTTTAILKTDGTLWMVGDNYLGQLGLGYKDTNLSDSLGNSLGIGYVDKIGQPIPRKQVPVKVLSGVKAVSALNEATLVLETDGSLWSFGMDGFGKGATTEPTKRATGITALASGALMAIKTDGSLYNWSK